MLTMMTTTMMMMTTMTMTIAKVTAPRLPWSLPHPVDLQVSQLLDTSAPRVAGVRLQLGPGTGRTARHIFTSPNPDEKKFTGIASLKSPRSYFGKKNDALGGG